MGWGEDGAGLQQDAVLDQLRREREQVWQELQRTRSEMAELSARAAALEADLQAYDRLIARRTGSGLPMPGGPVAGPSPLPETDGVAARAHDGRAGAGSAGRFADLTYPAMLRIIAREHGGRIRLAEAVEQIQREGGAKASKNLYNTLLTQIKRMKDFERVGKGTWELIR